MNLEEPVISVELAKLLVEKGFDVTTKLTWGTCPSYKGEPLDLDDEMDLRDSGVDDSEIVNMFYIYDIWWIPNHNENCYPAPTCGLLNEWFIKRWGICILVVPYITTEGVMWCYEIKRLRNNMVEAVCNKAGFDERKDCFESAATKVLTELI